jgi:hypothetical protein
VVVDGRGVGGDRVDRAGGRGAWRARVAGALAGCLRETDLVGWHRPGRAAAAVTGTRTDGSVARLLTDKVERGLEQALGTARASGLAVRVYAYDASGLSSALRLVPPMTAESGARATRRPEAAGRAAARVAPASAVPAAPR